MAKFDEENQFARARTSKCGSSTPGKLAKVPKCMPEMKVDCAPVIDTRPRSASTSAMSVDTGSPPRSPGRKRSSSDSDMVDDATLLIYPYQQPDYLSVFVTGHGYREFYGEGWCFESVESYEEMDALHLLCVNWALGIYAENVELMGAAGQRRFKRLDHVTTFLTIVFGFRGKSAWANVNFGWREIQAALIVCCPDDADWTTNWMTTHRNRLRLSWYDRVKNGLGASLSFRGVARSLRSLRESSIAGVSLQDLM